MRTQRSQATKSAGVQRLLAFLSAVTLLVVMPAGAAFASTSTPSTTTIATQLLAAESQTPVVGDVSLTGEPLALGAPLAVTAPSAPADSTVLVGYSAEPLAESAALGADCVIDILWCNKIRDTVKKGIGMGRDKATDVCTGIGGTLKILTQQQCSTVVDTVTDPAKLCAALQGNSALDKAQCDAAVAAFVDPIGSGTAWAISEAGEQLFKGLASIVGKPTEWVVTAVLSLILNHELGDSSLTNPQLVCNSTSDSDCNDTWFISQYGLMRNIGIFMLIPLFMLLAMQAIIKGSLFILLRGMLVMLPIAIIGSVVIISLSQLMLDISDDFTAFMVNNILSYSDDPAKALRSAIRELMLASFGLFNLVWLFLLLTAGFVIFIEMMLRYVVVYLSVLFLPLAFAGLVWPATAKWAKRMLELLLAMIFSKVFVGAGLALGLAAIGSQGGDQLTIDNDGLSRDFGNLFSVIQGVLIFGTVATGWVKVLGFTMSAMATGEGRFMNPAGGFNNMQMFNLTGGTVNKTLGKMANPRPKGGFSN